MDVSYRQWVENGQIGLLHKSCLTFGPGLLLIGAMNDSSESHP